MTREDLIKDLGIEVVETIENERNNYSRCIHDEKYNEAWRKLVHKYHSDIDAKQLNFKDAIFALNIDEIDKCNIYEDSIS